MRLKAMFAMLATGIVLTAVLSAAEGKKDKPKAIKCPVSGKDVTNCAVDYSGGKVCFCCGNCAKAFQEDQKKKPEERKFTAKANHQLYATKQAKLEKCVFSCKKLDPTTVIEIAGTKVCFCCGHCKAKVEKAEDKIEAVFNAKQFANGFKVAKKKQGSSSRK